MYVKQLACNLTRQYYKKSKPVLDLKIIACFFFLPIQPLVIICHIAPIAKPADFEVSSAHPKSYPDKLTMCIFKPR